MYGILSNIINWLNSNMLSFSDDIAIPCKRLFLLTSSWDVSLFSVLKERRQLKQ